MPPRGLAVASKNARIETRRKQVFNIMTFGDGLDRSSVFERGVVIL